MRVGGPRHLALATRGAGEVVLPAMIPNFLPLAEAEPTWQWLATVEDAINSGFEPIATAVGNVVFFSPKIGRAHV